MARQKLDQPSPDVDRDIKKIRPVIKANPEYTIADIAGATGLYATRVGYVLQIWRKFADVVGDTAPSKIGRPADDGGPRFAIITPGKTMTANQAIVARSNVEGRLAGAKTTTRAVAMLSDIGMDVARTPAEKAMYKFLKNSGAQTGTALEALEEYAKSA